MSRIAEVIKNKNKAQRNAKARRQAEISSLRADAIFKAKLHDELRLIDRLLDDNEVECVVITIPEKSFSMFTLAIYSDELAEYNIEQSDSDPNKFIVKRKYINI